MENVNSTQLDRDMVMGLYETREAADNGIDRLRQLGYRTEDISVMARQDEEVVVEDGDGSNVTDGVVGGAATGGALGALAGLLVGVGAIAIPGIGAVAVGGPLAAALGLTGAAATTATGAMTGALAGGLVGGLVGLGLPDDEAEAYEERLKQGGVLVAVPLVLEGVNEDIEEVLASTGASRIRTLRA